MRDDTGKYVLHKETVEQKTPQGVKTIFSKLFSNDAVLLQMKHQNMVIPTNLQVGSSMAHNVESKIFIAGAAPIKSEAVFSYKLLAIESLQTAGKKFPVTCKVERTLLSHNGTA